MSRILDSFMISKEFKCYNIFARLFMWFLIVLYSTSFKTMLHRTRSTALVISLMDAVELLGIWRTELIS